MPRTAARLLVDCLAEQGCERVFTVPGESFLPVLDALHDRAEIHAVTCRQEGGAAFMACADGAMTGRPGVCFVTRGPGATNASIGVHVAFQDSQPMILFVGDVDRALRDREGSRKSISRRSSRRSPNGRADRRRGADSRICRARLCDGDFRAARAGRARAARGHAARGGHRRRAAPVRAPPGAGPCPDALAAMMALIGDAAAPVAIVGGAGWNAKAREYFARFADRLGLPVATAFRRQDALPPSSPVYAGNLGYGPNPELVERIKAADLMLVVGARLGEATTDGYTLVTPDHPGQQLVHVHPDPNELNRVYRADLAICADVGEFAESAALWDEGEAIPFDAGAEAHRQWLEWSTPGDRGYRLDLAGLPRDRPARAARRCDRVQRRGQFLGLVAPLLGLRRLPVAARPDRGGDGLRPAGGRGRRRCASPNAASSRWPATAIS
jgi:acetolactate synthase-1/2/3 large subunit